MRVVDCDEQKGLVENELKVIINPKNTRRSSCISIFHTFENYKYAPGYEKEFMVEMNDKKHQTL